MTITNTVDSKAPATGTGGPAKVDFDAIVIGAGFAGLALIHYLRAAGRSVRVFDRASDVGGTWAWNRYPGAATDSESYYYCLTFSKELLQDWSWTKRYPDRDETQRYMRFVADKCDMWPDIQLNTEITDARYIAEDACWRVTTGTGETYTSKYFISGMGMISQPMIPNIKGLDRFKGPIFHSSRWPQQGLDYAGKRVGIPALTTTAWMVLQLIEPRAVPIEIPIVPFGRIFDAVANGEVDAALLIHEGRLIYPQRGLHLVVDLGVWWRDVVGLPLPLGVNVIRRELGLGMIRVVSEALRGSIR